MPFVATHHPIQSQPLDALRQIETLLTTDWRPREFVISDVLAICRNAAQNNPPPYGPQAVSA